MTKYNSQIFSDEKPMADINAEEIARAAREAAVAQQKAAEAQEKFKNSVDASVDGLRDFGSGLISFTRKITDGNAGMSKYGGAVNDAADGLGDAAMAWGPFGLILGAFIKVAGKLIGSVLETNDKVIAGYDKLAEMGAATTFNTESLRDLALYYNYTITDGAFTALTEAISEFGSNVTGLGATAGEGIAKFMSIVRIEPAVRDEFTRLGLNQKKVNALQSSYLAQEVKLGTSKKKSNDQLRNESVRYIKNLIELSALTGEKVEDIAKKREADLNDIAYNLKLQEISQQENGALIAERIKDGIDLVGQFGPVYRDAQREVIARDGILGDASQKLVFQFSQAGMNYVETVQKYNKGIITADELLQAYQKAAMASRSTLGQSMQASKEVVDLVAFSADSMKIFGREFKEGTAKAVKDEVAAASKRKDDLKETQTAIKDATLALTKAFDEFIKLISGPVNAGFRGLMYSFKVLSSGLLTFITRFKSFFKEAFGIFSDKDIDLTLPNLFESVDDLLSEQKRVNAEMLRIEKFLAKEGISQAPKPGEISFKSLRPDIAKESLAYWSLKQSKKEIDATLAKLLDNEDTKKQLALREKNQNDAKIKEDAEYEAKKQQLEAKIQRNRDIAQEQKYATESKPSPVTTPQLDSKGNITYSSGTTGAPMPEQKYKRGGIAQDPRSATNLLSNLTGNAKIPLPSGIDLPADVSLSPDLLSKLGSSKEQTVTSDNIFSALQNVMKDIQIDAIPANFDFGRKDLLKDSENIESLMGNYSEILQKNISETIKLPEKSEVTENNVNEILTSIAEKMDLLASKMKENTEIQYSALLTSRR